MCIYIYTLTDNEIVAGRTFQFTQKVIQMDYRKLPYMSVEKFTGWSRYSHWM